jgi:microcystin degradation protein MlrC
VKRVLTARLMHETNTFGRVPTDLAMIRRRDFQLDNEIPVAFHSTRSAFGSTFEAADKFGWTLVHPVSANPTMLYGLDHGRTQRGPMAELIARGEALEQSDEALVVSICAGFSRANIRDVGPSVTVTVDSNNPHVQAIAEEFMDYAWETRDFTTVKLLAAAEAVALARQGRPGDRPLVVADSPTTRTEAAMAMPPRS